MNRFHELIKEGRRSVALIVAALTVFGVLAPAGPVGALTGTHPALVVLCNFKDQTQRPNPVSYYLDMFSDQGAGKLGAYDYWHDVSYGNVSVGGTEVKGWYTLDMTRDDWGKLGRTKNWTVCAEAAKPDVDLHKYVGVVTVFPNAYSTLAAPISATDTSLTVTSTTEGAAKNFPTPPFKLVLLRGQLGGACASGTTPGQIGYCETVNVTAINGTTFTVERAQNGSTAGAFMANDAALVGNDLYGFTPRDSEIPGYTLGGEVMMHDQSLTLALHEEAHLLGFNHSRSVSAWPGNEYNDCYDIESALSCVYTFIGVLDGKPFGGPLGAQKGPGMNSILVDAQGWLPGARKTTFDNSTCRQQTYTMAALNHADKSGYQQIQIPASGTFPVKSGAINTDYYTVELRSKSGWDRGIPGDVFALHLKGSDGYSYLLNWDRDKKAVGVNDRGDLSPDSFDNRGRMYADATTKTYVAANSIDAANFAGIVTIGGCKINATLSYSGDTEAVYHQGATLAGDFVVAGTTAPVPNAGVTFTLGSQSCVGTTDLTGHASCSITVSQKSGSYTVSAGFAGNDVYNPASASAGFTIERAPTTLAYTGPTVILKGASGVTLTAILLEDGAVPAPPDPAGQTVTLSLGSQTCAGIVSSTGQVNCTLVFNGALGDESLSAVFAGDDSYLPSTDTGKSAIVFAFPPRGAFVLGDSTVAAATPSTKVYWWSDTWWSLNSLSGGPAPLSFKGFAGTVTLPTTTPADVCPKTFKTLPGTSPPPPRDVPTYEGVLVASSVMKTGNMITGVTGKIVVVKVDPGYAPNAGHPGTGTIVATFCG